MKKKRLLGLLCISMSKPTALSVFFKSIISNNNARFFFFIIINVNSLLLSQLSRNVAVEDVIL